MHTEHAFASLARHNWLEAAAQHCAGLIAEHGARVPDAVRVTVGFPGAGARSKAIGECWTPLASGDAHAEIFISPRLRDGVEIMATVLHELIHAAVGVEHGHKRPFARVAKACGLEGKMTATVPGAQLRDGLAAWIAEHGDYPAAGLDPMSNGKKKQPTRLLKASCECGYTVRVTKKWVVEVGAPHCPLHGAMSVEGLDAGEEAGEDFEE